MRAITIGLVMLCCVAEAGEPAQDSRALAEKVQQLYQSKQRTAAHELLNQRSSAATFTTHAQVRVSAVFDSRARGLTVKVERKAGVSGDLLVAIPPGTWAKPLPDGDDDDDDPVPQDLLLVRAPVMVLASSQRTSSVTIPVFCASFRRNGPRPGVKYELKTARKGSNLDALAQVLCALKKLHSTKDAEVALAIWIAHEDMAYHRANGMRSFRVPRQRVTPATRVGAEKLIRAAKMDSSRFTYFQQAPPLKPQRTKQPRAKKTKKKKKVQS